MQGLFSAVTGGKDYYRSGRSKSSSISNMKSTAPPTFGKTFMSRSYESGVLCNSEAVFMVKSQPRSGIFDFLVRGNAQNSLNKSNILSDPEKIPIKKRVYSANPPRQLRNNKGTNVGGKVKPGPLMLNCSQILAYFPQSTRQEESKRSHPYKLASRKCRIAIDRFDQKSRHMARIQGLTGLKIV